MQPSVAFHTQHERGDSSLVPNIYGTRRFYYALAPLSGRAAGVG
ncbi:hypothetical protein ApDm4_2727 [Acetobacter pomorum]|nr:hypothetical protein ApDm4_2727 [Acetobacter pomorum]